MKGLGGYFRFWGNNDNPCLTGLWLFEERAPGDTKCFFGSLVAPSSQQVIRSFWQLNDWSIAFEEPPSMHTEA